MLRSRKKLVFPHRLHYPHHHRGSSFVAPITVARHLEMARTMQTTSVSLLERLRQPNDHEAAWEPFVELYGPLLLTWARRLGLPPADSDDLVQEVMALLLVKLPQFERRGAGSFRGWLRTVTRHKWLELQRRKY